MKITMTYAVEQFDGKTVIADGVVHYENEQTSGQVRFGAPFVEQYLANVLSSAKLHSWCIRIGLVKAIQEGILIPNARVEVQVNTPLVESVLTLAWRQSLEFNKRKDNIIFYANEHIEWIMGVLIAYECQVDFVYHETVLHP